jgi:4-diphosphocytidyl-2-C-methyl-D-erythritol kinase
MPPSPTPVRSFAPAKINLFLHVGERRADGFHDLESLVAFADVGDELMFEPSSEFSLEIKGPFASGLENGPTNLVARAAELLAEQLGVKCAARVTLTKNLPVSSGIGGGSADAAAALRGLSRLWSATGEIVSLKKVAESLGSDVPVCLASTPSWMEGHGDRVASVPALPGMAVVLANPGIAVSTAQVFGALKARRGLGLTRPRQFPSSTTLVEYLRQKTNDLEAPARLIAPAIGAALDALKSTEGVELARMCGSGATTFALYNDITKATAAAAKLSRAEPDWWVLATKFPPRSPD